MNVYADNVGQCPNGDQIQYDQTGHQWYVPGTDWIGQDVSGYSTGAILFYTATINVVYSPTMHNTIGNCVYIVQNAPTMLGIHRSSNPAVATDPSSIWHPTSYGALCVSTNSDPSDCKFDYLNN